MVNGHDWQRVKLNKIVKIVGGGTPSINNPSYWNGDIPWFTPSDITNYRSKYIFNSNRYITHAGLKHSSALLLPKGTILLCTRATIGEMSILAIEGATNQGFQNLVSQNKVETDFLYYALMQNKNNIIAKAKGSTFLEISKNELGKIQISIPNDRNEQIAIANALSDADSLIASLQKFIAKKKAIKQGTMQELLTGKRRLPGFSGEWCDKQIKDICEVINGGTPSTSVTDYWGGNILWCTPTDITASEPKYISKTATTITRKGQLARSLTILPPGTILLCSRATIGEARIAMLPITTNQGFKSLIVDRQTNNEWLYYLISQLKNVFLEKANGSTFLEISKNSLSSISIRTPSLNEQIAIGQVLSDMDAEIEKLEKKLSKYQKIKQGMMQELLTGRIRLVDAEPKQEQQVTIAGKKHNQQFDDAVMIAGIVNAFYSETFPLGRKKVQKLLYLMRRKEKADVSVFHKKAAGPYADSVRYNGGETIAEKRNYIAAQTNGKGTLFRRGAKIGKALGYIQSWGKQASIDWLTSNFQYTRVDDLELFATVDMAICDLRKVHKPISVQTIKEFIQSTKEWRKKLDKSYFSDPNIQRAINKCREFFGEQ